MSRTNIDIDDALVKEAEELTNIKTKRELVDVALRELVRQHKRRKLLSLRRKGLWEGNLDEWREGRF